MGKTFSYISLTKIFSGQSPKATEIKPKKKKQKTKNKKTKTKNQCDLIKQAGFCTVKKPKKKTKGQITEWEKIVSNDATDKGLIIKIYK